MIEIRQAKSRDIDALYRISVETGHHGRNARQLYADPQMMGHIYAAPYLMFEPDLAHVLTCDDHVVGFCVGTSDTTMFETKLEIDWWPSLRNKYRKPDEKMRLSWSADERRSEMIHVPEITPKQITRTFPAHIHMNLLPIVQGQGFGVKMFQKWSHDAAHSGITRIHIGANAKNTRALHFWRNQGFTDIDIPNTRTVWMGRQLPK